LFVKLIKLLLLFSPFVAAIFWTTAPAISGLDSIYSFPSKLVQNLDTSGEQSDLWYRRKIQKHFLNSRVFISMDDIITVNKEMEKNDDGVRLLRKSCGDSSLYIWVPFRFRLPLLGERIYEYCWKPRNYKA
jgi:hypothetical protein